MTLTPTEQQHLSEHGWFLRRMEPQPPDSIREMRPSKLDAGGWAGPALSEHGNWYLCGCFYSGVYVGDRIGEYTVASVEPVRHEGAWWWKITIKRRISNGNNHIR